MKEWPSLNTVQYLSILSHDLMANSNVSEQDAYLYSPLPTSKSLRLLQILPPDGSKYVRCSLTVIEDLHDAPQYEAVSYFWGHRTPKATVVCNSLLRQVTPNLEKILRQFRTWRFRPGDQPRGLARIKKAFQIKKETKLPEFARRFTPEPSTHSTASGYLWIDALCINQDDIQERSCQVSIMREIYIRASRVIVWLEGDHSELLTALSLLNTAWVNYCRDRPVEGGKFVDYEPQWDMVKRDNNISRGFPDIHDPAWQCLNQFLDHNWFSRVWVIQEVAVSSTCVMVCGDVELQWSAIGRAAFWLERKGYSYVTQNLHGRKISHASLIWQLNASGPDNRRQLSDLLRSSRGFSSTLRHDKIYAVLGLAASHAAGDSRRPDYSKAADEVYMEVTKSIIEEEQSLGVLTSVRHGDSLPQTGPSWIPNWEWEEQAGSMLSGGDINHIYHASKGTKVEIDTNCKLNVLRLRGIVAGKITHTSLAIISPDNFLDHTSPLLPAWENLQQAITRLTTPTSTGRPLELVFTLVVTAGMDFSRKIGGNSQQYWLDASIYWGLLGADGLKEACSKAAMESRGYNEPFSIGDLASFSHAVSFACDGRRLLMTQNGYIGVGPRAMNEGDDIAILQGASVPYVLRRCGSAYQFVGECFVEGLMGSEAMGEQTFKDPDPPLQDFSLV